MTTPLTFTHLRFQARAFTPIRLGQYQGAERLRDGLAQVMLRAVCPETHRMERPSFNNSDPIVDTERSWG
jgi:hypothetical protein